MPPPRICILTRRLYSHIPYSEAVFYAVYLHAVEDPSQYESYSSPNDRTSNTDQDPFQETAAVIIVIIVNLCIQIGEHSSASQQFRVGLLGSGRL